MEFKRAYLEKENGKKYMFTFNKTDDIAVGTVVLSGIKRPISSHYNGQYKLTTGEVIVLQDSQIVAMLADFDSEFSLEDSSLNPVQVLNEEGAVDIVYIAYGEGLSNIDTAVFDDPAGEAVFADGAVFMGRWKINIVGGLVDSTEEVVNEPTEGEGEGGRSSKVELFINGAKTEGFIKGTPKLILVVGTVVYADEELGKTLRDGIYLARDIYLVTIKGGAVHDLAKQKPVVEEKKK